MPVSTTSPRGTARPNRAPLSLYAAFAATLCAIELPAQQPRLMTPAAAPITPGGTRTQLPISVAAAPGNPYLVLADIGGGPVTALETRFLLDLSSSLTVVQSGITAGVDTFLVPLPNTMPFGVPVWLQAVVVDPQLPSTSGLSPSNGESFIAYDGRTRALADRFENALLDGFTGNFDASRRGVLAGGQVRRRVYQTVDPQGVPFFAGLRNPLNANGARTQMVYRPQDLGGDGFPEDIVALRWRPVGPVVADDFDVLDLRLGHTEVQPDYSVDSFTALPRFPNSGLSEVFASNYLQGQAPVQVYLGAYPVRPAAINARGYMPFPDLQQTFRWNGTQSLLVESFVPVQQTASGVNGAQVRLMVQSSPRPNARVFADGGRTGQVDPYAQTVGQGDNSLYDLEVEFLRTTSLATSPWRQARPGADYLTASVAARLPAGTAYQLSFRGADDANGGNATPWSNSIDRADGREFIQYRVELQANSATSEVPELESLLITWR